MNEPSPRPFLETAENYWQAALATLQWWQEQGRPAVAAFIQGSVAHHRKLLPGSDIDLCIVTPETPDPAWFQERLVGPFPVEIYPLAQRTFDDLDGVLAQPALPFNLCEGLVVFDPFHWVTPLQTRLRPVLCAQPFRQRRVATCFHQAQVAYLQAQTALHAADLLQARLQITVGLWNTIGMVCAFLGRCPTNRRGFVLIWQCAAQWQRPDLIARAEQALGGVHLTWQEVQRLVNQAASMKPRARESILALRDATEAMQAVWPLLCTVVWEGSADDVDPQAQQQVLSALRYDTREHLSQRYLAAFDLTQSLWEYFSSFPQNA